MIQLKQIDLQDFTSFKRAQLDYPTHGLILVEGKNLDSPGADSNMSGKTNLISEALNWVLFEEGTKEKTLQGTRVSTYRVEDVIRRGADECRVTLRLEIEGETWTVVRVRKRTGASSLDITMPNGKPLKAATKAAMQRKLERLIGCNWKSFNQTVMYGQGSRRFTQAQDAERKQVMEDMLGLSVYSEALVRVREERKRAVGQLHDVEIQSEGYFNMIEEYMEQQETLQEIYDDQVESLKRWKAERDKKIKDYKTALSIDRANLDRQRQIIEDRQRAIDTERETLDEVDLMKLKQALRAADEKKMDIISRRARVSTQIEANNRRIEELARLDTSAPCPVCEQPMTTEHVSEHLESHRGEAKKLDATRSKLAASQRTVETRAETINSEIDDHEAKVLDLDRRQNELDRDVFKLQSLVEQLDRYADEIEQLKQSKAPIAADRDPLERVEKKITNAKRNLKASRKREQQLGQTVEDLDFWVRGFGNAGIKSMMLDSVLPLLNARANEYLAVLVGDTEIEFDTQSFTDSGKAQDRFEIRVYSDGGEGYHLASGGERKRIDFCVALALQSLRPSTDSTFGFYILDEPFEGMDGTGIEEVIDLLRHFADSEGMTCYVVSHDVRMQALFDERIKVVKQYKESRLVP